MTVIVNREPLEQLRVGANTAPIRLRSEDTAGELSVVEFRMPAGTLGATPHIHDAHSEDFVIVSGEVTFEKPLRGRRRG